METILATPDLVPRLLDCMGPERAATVTRGMASPLEAFTDAIHRSALTWCGVAANNDIVSLGGITPAEAGTGYLWQYLGRGVRDHKRGYIQQGRAVMRDAGRHFGRLLAMVEADNPAAIRHFRRLGWTVSPPEPVQGRMACRCTITLERSDAHE